MSEASTPLPSAQSLAATIAAHLMSLSASGYASSTLASRRLHLALLRSWSEQRGLVTIGDLTPDRLEEYRGWLRARRRQDGAALAWSTQANQLTAVRMLLAWATRTRRIMVNPAAELLMPRSASRLPRAVLSIGETERVLHQPDIQTKLGLRDRAIMEVLYSTGIRRMELLGLELNDLDPERGILFVREGKGRRDRVVPVGDRAIRWVKRYLDQARPHLVRRTDCGRLFVCSRGTSIRPNRLTERLHGYIRSAGITKPGSVHVFRHTMATQMHDAGADIRDLQEILGHAKLSTTEIYTRVSIARLKAVHKTTHPAEMSSD